MRQSPEGWPPIAASENAPLGLPSHSPPRLPFHGWPDERGRIPPEAEHCGLPCPAPPKALFCWLQSTIRAGHCSQLFSSALAIPSPWFQMPVHVAALQYGFNVLLVSIFLCWIPFRESSWWPNSFHFSHWVSISNGGDLDNCANNNIQIILTNNLLQTDRSCIPNRWNACSVPANIPRGNTWDALSLSSSRMREYNAVASASSCWLCASCDCKWQASLCTS